MSLKQYNPHLQLTIHKPRQLLLGLRLLSALMMTLLFIGSSHAGLLLVMFGVVIVLHVLTEKQLSVEAQELTLTGHVAALGEGEFELESLRILFGCLLLLSFKGGRQAMLLCRDQFDQEDWQAVLRFNKLQKLEY